MDHDTAAGVISSPRRRRLWASLIACALGAQAAHAGEVDPAPRCVCHESVKPLEALEHYDMIFFGLASFLGISESGDLGNEDEFVEFSVEAIWKGPVQRRLRVHNTDGDPLCAFRFKLGARYLVYALHEDVPFSNRYRTSACARTTGASSALPDLAILGTPNERLDE
jgi:hypothetical protein